MTKIQIAKPGFVLLLLQEVVYQNKINLLMHCMRFLRGLLMQCCMSLTWQWVNPEIQDFCIANRSFSYEHKLSRGPWGG